MPQRTVPRDETAGLLDRTVHRRQPEPDALPLFLRREERLEDAGQRVSPDLVRIRAS